MEEIREKFAVIADWRHSGYIKYNLADVNLADVLVIVFCAVLCGMSGLTEIYTYAGNHMEYFKEALGIERMISRAELGRILAAVDEDAVGRVMVELLQERLDTTGDVVTVDGRQSEVPADPKWHTAHCKF